MLLQKAQRLEEAMPLQRQRRSAYINSGGRMLQFSTQSLHTALSPAMFPKAQTACKIITQQKIIAVFGDGHNQTQHTSRAKRSNLLLDVLKVRVKQFNEDWHCSSLNHCLCLHGCARRYVGQRPCCLELQGDKKSNIMNLVKALNTQLHKIDVCC